MKIILADIESSLTEALTFDYWDASIPHENITTERHIHTIAWKEYGKSQVNVISQLDDRKRWKKNIHDDFYVVSEFRKVLETADFVVFHNGNSFDIPMIQGRILLNELPPLPKIESIDTYRIAKKYFKLPYNNLNYLAKMFRLGGKTENPKGLWRSCFEGNEDAMKQLAKYNKNDVVLLEGVFKRLMPYVKFPMNKSYAFQNLACDSDDIRLE